MRYRANKKVSLWRRRQQDPHQKQYAPSPLVGDITIQLTYLRQMDSIDFAK